MKAEGSAVNPAPVGLRELTATWEDVQRSRLAAEQRGLLPVAEAMHKLEDKLGRDVKKGLTAHPLGDWLPKGLGGVHVARLIALIEDPWRFPGRRCTEGHYMSVSARGREIEASLGDACSTETWDGPCSGTLLPPRPGTGVRSLWHYCGLHVVEGRSPRKRKGQRVDWNPVARTVVLMPGGIAEQIVRLRVEKYRDIYDANKTRLTDTRAVTSTEDVAVHGAPEGSEVDVSYVSDRHCGLRPFQVDAIARKVAAKAFLGDLLMEWKRRTDHVREFDRRRGPAPHAHEEVAA